MSIATSTVDLQSDMCPLVGSSVNHGCDDPAELPENKHGMFQTFQSWALRNYGDSGKTKTVTRRKYERIIRILNGEEQSTAENSKFRFWVKAKGFRVGGDTAPGNPGYLHVPTRGNGDGNAMESDKGFKKVAVVEDFFDIIYNVHVEMDGRGGKHAGQKRTYRAIAETYAFLPREAVTRFLMSCSDCQKRMHLTSETLNNNNKPPTPITDDSPGIDFSLPITQTYLNRMRITDYGDKVYQNEDSMSSEESEVSRERSVSPHTETASSPSNGQKTEGADETSLSPVNMATGAKCPRLEEAASQEKPIAITPVTVSPEPNRLSPIKSEDTPVEKLSAERLERKRRASDELSMDSSTKASESGNLEELQTVRDDDDDDENDDDDKVLPGQDIDPERLKAFNMFVRLFVDENLDRMVPISKQPKDKIQAILEACDRQFPEFHERARKRIRTYLKSCRRMRRSKEQNGWEPLRPTPPHLTSAAAEGILAQACENESNNAKRMRMGLDPLPAAVMQNRGTTSAPAPVQPPQPTPPASTTQTQAPERQSAPPPPPQPPQPAQPAIPKAHTPTQPPAIDRPVAPAADFLRHTPAAFRPPHDFHPPFFANGNGLFRPGFPTGYQPPAHHHPQLLQHQPLQHTQVQNGPTDLSLKKQNSKNQLSPSEVATIKQLIAGYRESAAFLYRSADELEQLLLQQN